jgi:hypothetical protein
MLAGGGFQQQRLDSAFLAKAPDALDIINDIFTPGKTEAFRSQLRAYLSSRLLFQTIVERPPTMQGIALANPHASGQQIQDAYDMIMATRQVSEQKLSTLLPQCIKSASLSYMDAADMNAMVNAQDGLAIYNFIMRERLTCDRDLFRTSCNRNMLISSCSRPIPSSSSRSKSI